MNEWKLNDVRENIQKLKIFFERDKKEEKKKVIIRF